MRAAIADSSATHLRLALDLETNLCYTDVADPWYTDRFETTWQDVLTGCQGLLEQFKRV